MFNKVDRFLVLLYDIVHTPIFIPATFPPPSTKTRQVIRLKSFDIDIMIQDIHNPNTNLDIISTGHFQSNRYTKLLGFPFGGKPTPRSSMSPAT